IGAGIVGNSMAYHLSRLGWTDLVLLEQGALPNPGGSTGHASNFIFPVDHSKEMTTLTKESARQYEELGRATSSGGVEVARRKERMEELNRRMSSALSWGEEGCELLTPEQVLEKVPFVDTDVILGGFYTPGVSVVDPLRAGTLMREYAQERGASVFASTEVTGVDVENNHVRRVHTDRGSIDAEAVFVACGIWSPRIARMAGATIPLSPAVHQMISVGPIPLFEATPGEISFPIVRDVDTNMYERQNGSDMEVGSYAHRPILLDADDIPTSEEAALHSADVARFYPHQRTKRHVDARSSEGYNRTYGIVHPMEQWLSNREVRLSPFYARERELGAVFYETAGWERPWWYESNAPL